MIYKFEGIYSFDEKTVGGWKSTAIGVYYCGIKTAEGSLVPYYIGRAIADGGIRNRLLQHLGERKWRDVTHFGYKICSTEKEAIDHEISEIATYKPKYNVQSK